MKLFHSFALLALLLGGESTAAVKKETRKLVRLCCVLSSGNKFYWILQFPYTGSSYLSPRALLLACCINFQMYLYPTPETAGAPPTAVPTKSPVYVTYVYPNPLPTPEINSVPTKSPTPEPSPAPTSAPTPAPTTKAPVYYYTPAPTTTKPVPGTTGLFGW